LPVLDHLTDPAQLRSMTDAELDRLAAAMRAKMIRTVKQTGGHLASSLGAVEIALALHRVMDSPRDRVVWDTGHQAYAHKLLTGRGDQFDTLRQIGGVGGFPRRSESEHDVFDGGHAGTGVSIGVGLAAARDLLPAGDPDREQRIAVCVGDAALQSGLTMEALNHLGHTKHRLLIVLNDNEMSISPSVGGLSTRLNKLRLTRAYQGTKSVTKGALERIPFVGRPLFDALAFTKEGFKRSWAKVGFFEDMGITYVGVLDGHNLRELEATFECWTITSTLARDTTRVKVGQMVGCNGYRNPALYAKIASTVDVASHGRLYAGIGAGWYEHEWRAYGYGFPELKDRMAMFREACEIIHRMWTEDKPAFSGNYYSIDQPINEPKSAKLGRKVPLWIGGGGEQVTLRLVAQYGDACNVGGGDPASARGSPT